jgi:hypothetical protein
MPQPRVPTATLKAKGSFLKHPERARARKNEPTPHGPLGDAPAALTKEEAQIWDELSAALPTGVAFSSDQAAFEVLVCLVANFRQRRRRKEDQVVGELAQMNKLFVQFGMTPADRSRVKATPAEPPKQDKWAAFNLPSRPQ